MPVVDAGTLVNFLIGGGALAGLAKLLQTQYEARITDTKDRIVAQSAEIKELLGTNAELSEANRALAEANKRLGETNRTQADALKALGESFRALGGRVQHVAGKDTP